MWYFPQDLGSEPFDAPISRILILPVFSKNWEPRNQFSLKSSDAGSDLILHSKFSMRWAASDYALVLSDLTRTGFRGKNFNVNHSLL